VGLHAAISHQTPVAMFSLEMSKQQVVQRMLCSEALVDLGRLLRGRLQDDDFGRLAQAAGHLNTAPVWIDDSGSVSVLEMRAKARRLKADQPDLGLIIIDYIQLMSGGGDAENRQQEVSAISRGLKSLAKELDVPIIALSQLSRAPEQRSDHRPQLSDLRESGSIEQDADLVMFLYRPEYYHTPMDAQEKGIQGKAELIISKQRNGPTGMVDLYFRKECARFESYSHAQQH
jgi:replicative DNA helicase